MVKVKIIQSYQDLPLPKYQTLDSAGMDVHSAQTLILKKGDIATIPTGLKMALPKGYELHIRPRSGLAAKYGITVLNTPGTLDADYRGELKVILINHGQNDFEIKKGDRIAQIILNKYECIEWEEVDGLDNTKRDIMGFGSTGL
ncbi:MAG: dUTP diphosphatase [Nanoarchaeota archaeon]|nr:dUTP diphosphatase [Nanoarchaeota archaeon]